MRRNSVGLGTVHCSVGLGTGGREAPGNSCTVAAWCIAWYTVHGALCMVLLHGTVHGAWYTVHGAWYMVDGAVAWYNIYGAW